MPILWAMGSTGKPTVYTDVLLLCMIKRLHMAYWRWPVGYVQGFLGYNRVQRVNRMHGLPGRFVLDGRGHMTFVHQDGRTLHPWTRDWYLANGAHPDSLFNLERPEHWQWRQECRIPPGLNLGQR